MVEVLVRDEEIARLARKILWGLATDNDLQAAKPEDVRAIKCDTGEVHYRAIAAEASFKVDGEGSPRRRKFIASQESRDRMGDVIKVAGWDFKTFRKNPQALWAHQDRNLPIGLVTDIEKGDVGGIPTLFETIDYLSEDLNPQAEAIFRMVEAGAIRAVSVGFLPTKTTWPQSTEERDSMDLGPYGVLYEKQEQLELSNCTVPAHPAALASKMVRRALTQLVEEGKLAKDAAGALLDDIARLRKKRAPWFGYRASVSEEERLPETEAAEDATEEATVDAEVTPADGQTRDDKPLGVQIAEARVFAGLQPGNYHWDGKALVPLTEPPPFIVKLARTEGGPTPTETKLLEAIDELREKQEEIAKAQVAAVEEIASLQGVLRSSSRHADATKFYGEVLKDITSRLQT